MVKDTADYRSHTTFNSFVSPVFRRVRKIARIFIMPVCPFVRMEQLDSQCVDFGEILYSSISPRSVKKIHFSLNSNKNDG